MKRVILGTAGHIDHGKTSLVKALTGIDTDRLKEEKERGITIELGFANLTLPSGQMLGIIDVPGHERFVKNMVAGAATIDLVVLVLAADEGVMPQTREHLDICQLLGVKKGLVALTKKDMVDEEWLKMVVEEAVEFLKGTFLEGAAIIPVSSVTGEGLHNFLQALEFSCKEVEEKSGAGVYRLPVDRVFTMKGFGTVVTGTSISGSVAVGETVNVYPQELIAKVRGLQVHGHGVESAAAGSRTAINLQGLEKGEVDRGNVIAALDALRPSYMVDIFFSLLKSAFRPFKSRSKVRFHTGTCEILGTIILLDRDELQPGESTFAQIHLDDRVAVFPRDRYVVRSYSPVRTIGGGEILAVAPPRHRRFRQETLDHLTTILRGSDEERILSMVEEANHGITRTDLARIVDVPPNRLGHFLEQLQYRNSMICFDKEKAAFIHANKFKILADKIMASLKLFHTQFPLKVGIKRDELKSKVAYQLDVKLLNKLLQELQGRGKIAVEGDLVRLSGHKVLLKEEQEKLRAKLEQIYMRAGLTPPYFRDLADQLPLDQAKDVVLLLLAGGILIKVKEDLYFHAGAIEQLKSKLVAFLKDQGDITTAEFKEMTGVSRKYTIPIFEYFDGMQLTMRVGEKRVLRSRI
jgi:selenocysteine-specific elongation factor